MRYLFPQVGVRSLQKLLHLPSKVPAHFRRAHAAQGAECQALHILGAVIKVTADWESNGSRNYQEETRNWGRKCIRCCFWTAKLNCVRIANEIVSQPTELKSLEASGQESLVWVPSHLAHKMTCQAPTCHEWEVCALSQLNSTNWLSLTFYASLFCLR